MQESKEKRSGTLGLILMLILAAAVVLLSNPIYMWLSGSGNGISYTSVQRGYGGEVTVTLVEENGVIMQLKAEGPAETPGIGGSALSTFNESFQEAKGAALSELDLSIDAVSGATLTSRAVKKGLADVVEQARSD